MMFGMTRALLPPEIAAQVGESVSDAGSAKEVSHSLQAQEPSRCMYRGGIVLQRQVWRMYAKIITLQRIEGQ